MRFEAVCSFKLWLTSDEDLQIFIVLRLKTVIRKTVEQYQKAAIPVMWKQNQSSHNKLKGREVSLLALVGMIIVRKKKTKSPMIRRGKNDKW